MIRSHTLMTQAEVEDVIGILSDSMGSAERTTALLATRMRRTVLVHEDGIAPVNRMLDDGEKLKGEDVFGVRSGAGPIAGKRLPPQLETRIREGARLGGGTVGADPVGRTIYLLFDSGMTPGKANPFDYVGKPLSGYHGLAKSDPRRARTPPRRAGAPPPRVAPCPAHPTSTPASPARPTSPPLPPASPAGTTPGRGGRS